MTDKVKRIGESKIYLVWTVLAISIIVILAYFIDKSSNKSKAENSLSSPTISATISVPMQEEIKELKVEDITVGDGAEAVSGKKVTVNYSGTLLDGKKFDSSYDRGVPFSFNLGAGEVIKGWDMGVAGMKVGGKRKLTIPSSLGYGSRGAGDVIPPNSTLVFEIDLLKVE